MVLKKTSEGDASISPASNKDHLRLLYILPLFANIGVIASVAALCEFISQESYDESHSPIPQWIFFASSVVFAPTMIAVCKVLPDPSHSLCIGGLISTTGLVWTALVHGHHQMFIFGFLVAMLAARNLNGYFSKPHYLAVSSRLIAACGLHWYMNTGKCGFLVGLGVTLSLTSSSISLAPYFVQRSKKSAVCLLVTTGILMVSVHSGVVKLVSVLGYRAFIIFCPAVFITAVVPFLTKCWLDGKGRSNKDRSSRPNSFPEDLEAAKPIIEKSCDSTTVNQKSDSVCQCIKQRFRSMTFQDGWLVSIISVIVWLFWGAGVDSTWYSMLSSPGVDSSWLAVSSHSSSTMGQNVILVQLMFSMAVLLIKISTEPKDKDTSSSSSSPLLSYHSNSHSEERLVFGCNYMFLGILGVGGLLVALLPEHVVPFHNQLIFSIGFALQFDDLCDLKPEDDNKSLSKHPRKIYGVTLKQLDDLEPKKSGVDLCCLVCHLLSILMMSCLAMLLGLQLSNGIVYLLSLTPISYLFSTVGLCFMSSLSIVLSLAQPDTWL